MKKRVLKKLITGILLLALVCVSLAACSGKKTDADKGDGAAEENEESEPTALVIGDEDKPSGDDMGEDEENSEDQTDEGNESEGEAETDPVKEVLSAMSLEEKIAQLFIIVPESLVSGVDVVTAAGDATKEAINNTPVGGVVYLSSNLKSPYQTKEMLENIQSYSRDRIGLPLFLCADEEGGTVCRIAGNAAFGVTDVGNMSAIGESQDTAKAYEAGSTIGKYMSELGFNVDFAPVADVLSNSENQVIGRRSFGTDPELVADMAKSLADGLADQGIISVYKHFPGHGATAGDTHAGYAYTDKTYEELEQCELVPFAKGVEEGIPMIMAAHISLPQVTGDDVPASLSKKIITEILREKLGYDGLVVTDALNMAAVVSQYSSAEAAVKALDAGADLLLMPQNFTEAYNGVINAVNDGRITEERIDESLVRIVKVKLEWEEKSKE